MRINPEQIFRAEKSVLAASIMEPWAMKSVINRLSDSDFIYPVNKTIFAALRKMANTGTPVDFLTLANEVEGNQAIKDYGGVDYIIELCNFLPSAVNVDQYIALVTENSRETRILQEAAKILQSDDPAIPQLEKLIERERAVMDQAGSRLQIMEDIESFIICLQNPNQSRLMQTGFSTLDERLGGLERGSVSCIAARPSAGKTAFALNCMTSAIYHGHRAAFFSLEMSKAKILGRLGAALANVDNSDIKKRNVPTDKILDISSGLVTLASGNRFYLYDGVRSIAGIREEIARVEPTIVFVDYLQLVEAEHRAENENYRLASIVQEFKRLVRIYDCHICYLSQIGRAGDAKPTMKDLYGSGAIEQASDCIMFLDRPFVRDKSFPSTEASIAVGKNKDGECGTVHLYFDGPHQTFTEVNDRYEAVNGSTGRQSQRLNVGA